MVYPSGHHVMTTNANNDIELFRAPDRHCALDTASATRRLAVLTLAEVQFELFLLLVG
jgi:hypothetical protein